MCILRPRITGTWLGVLFGTIPNPPGKRLLNKSNDKACFIYLRFSNAPPSPSPGGRKARWCLIVEVGKCVNPPTP